MIEAVSGLTGKAGYKTALPYWLVIF